MDRLRNIEDCLMAQIQGQMGNLAAVDTKELGEVIDMVKDLEEAIYYCTITKSMEKGSEKDHYYYPVMDYANSYNSNGGGRSNYSYDMDYNRMYYNDARGTNGSENMSGRNNFHEYPIELRDYREGRSPKSRRMYMESKEMHHGKTVKIHELEQYMRELSDDITEMIEGASQEEKELLSTKLNGLAAKIDA